MVKGYFFERNNRLLQTTVYKHIIIVYNYFVLAHLLKALNVSTGHGRKGKLLLWDVTHNGAIGKNDKRKGNIKANTWVAAYVLYISSTLENESKSTQKV